VRLNDPAAVRAQYADERGLRARQALWRELEGPDPKEVLWETLVACAPKRVLEVGGGDGWLSARLREELGCKVVLVDQSERMVHLARERGVDARIGDIQALPFDDGSFDTVVAAWMLYHVTDLDRGLSELARVLRPGGRLVANTNSREHVKELFDLIGYPQDARHDLFNAENGEESLRRHFADVERRDIVAVATVRDRQTLVDYQTSLMVETAPVPDDVPLPFRVHSRGVVFVATK
jgi:SAM-dependent methyltransferase